MMIEGEDDDQTHELPPEDEEVEGTPQPEAEDEGDLEIEIEGEEAEEETPLVKTLRQQLRDTNGELTQYRKQSAPRVADPGPKPTLEGCEWDEAKFEAQYDAWKDATAKAQNASRDDAERQRVNNMEFERLTIRHQQRAEVLKIPNFEEYQRVVVDALGPEMAGAALVLADDSAKLVAALGRNPAALARITAEPNPLKQIKLLLQTEAKIVMKKKGPPPPERDTITRSSTSAALLAGDKKMEAMEKEAARTGDRSKIVAYKASLRAA